MSDLIYKQDAIDAFDCSISGVPADAVKYVSEYAHKMMCRIGALQSAQPDRKTGRWIINGNYMTCNKCGICMCNTDREGDPIPKGFCPNCGVKMVGKR